MNEENMEQELVSQIAKSLVTQPDMVQVNFLEGEKSIILELQVAKDDLGRVIGKQGRTAKAIRTLLSAIKRPDGKRVMLEVLD